MHVPGLGTVSTYAIVLALYFGLALWLTLHVAVRNGISAEVVLRLFAWCVPAGIMGARVLDMLEYPGSYRTWSDGLGRSGSSIYGAFIVVLPIVAVYLRRQHMPVLLVLDTGAPAMALGEAMSRIGCFLNGCCYGVPWNGRWAVTFPSVSFAYHDQIARGLLSPHAHHSLPVHPAQLYSMAIMAVVFVLLYRMVRRPHRDGAVFFTFLVAYGALRLAMIPFRTEVLASMTAFSVGFILAGGAGLLVTREARRSAALSRPA